MLLHEVERDGQQQENTGWVCPKCHESVAPRWDICPNCQEVKVGENRIPQDKRILMG
jgi:uncharacterized OB-fold protein